MNEQKIKNLEYAKIKIWLSIICVNTDLPG